MAAYVSGDVASFRVLFDRYAPLLERVLHRKLQAPETVRDLIQQTFLQLHRSRHDFRKDALLRPWLLTIALNLQREHFRRVRRHREDSMDPSNEPAGERAGHGQGEARHDLQRRIEALPDDQREVIMLHWFEGLSFVEIAQLVGATPGAVRVRAHRGYEALRASLGLDGNTSAPDGIPGDE